MPSFNSELGMDTHSIIVLATLAGALILFITDALRYEVIAVGVAVTLAATGVLEADVAFGGFSSPAVFLVAAMYVFGAAFNRWGVTESIGQRFLGGSESSERALVFRIVLLSGLLSSFLSNAGVVAILIPVLGTLSKETKIPASRLFMPLAFGSLLGGLVTLIGTSKNLAVNEILSSISQEATTLMASGADYPATTEALSQIQPFTLFEFTGLGLVLLAIGALYFLGPGLKLLPRKREDESLSDHYHVREFVTEMLVKPSSTLINRAMGDAEFLKDHDVTVLGIVRQDASSILAPGPYNRIRPDDTLVLQGEPDAILKVRRELDLQDAGSVEVGGTQLYSGDVALVEAVIPPGSSLLGQSLSSSEYQEESGLNVIALSKGGKLQDSGIRHALLQVGDTVLIQGHLREIERAKRTRELLILEQKELQPMGPGGLITVLTLSAVLVLAFMGIMNIAVAAITGALFLVAARLIQPHEVYRAMDWTALILIGGMLALGKAFQVTGLADQVAYLIQDVAGESMGPHLLVGIFLVVTGLLTQLTTHIAAAVIMAPIAVSTAVGLGINDRPLLMAVLAGASLAFMSPVAHQANTMVMGPGDYRYKDFLRAGTPLTIVEYIAAFFLIPVFFPFAG